jgi:hypothetical protein
MPGQAVIIFEPEPIDGGDARPVYLSEVYESDDISVDQWGVRIEKRQPSQMDPTRNRVSNPESMRCLIPWHRIREVWEPRE